MISNAKLCCLASFIADKGMRVVYMNTMIYLRQLYPAVSGKRQQPSKP
jgi:hypothetical protein